MNGVSNVIIVLPLLLAYSGMALGQPPETFAAAKRLAAAIHEDISHQLTVYCGCPYVRTGRSGGDLDRDACGLTARQNEKRSDRLEWEHVVPASWIGEQHSCWSDGHPRCVTKDGSPFKGRKCCTKRGVDPAFMAAHNDVHNLLPAGGEVNGDRLHHPFGTVAGEPRAYGTCDFEVGGAPKVRACPAPSSGRWRFCERRPVSASWKRLTPPTTLAAKDWSATPASGIAAVRSGDTGRDCPCRFPARPRLSDT